MKKWKRWGLDLCDVGWQTSAPAAKEPLDAHSLVDAMPAELLQRPHSHEPAADLQSVRRKTIEHDRTGQRARVFSPPRSEPNTARP